MSKFWRRSVIFPVLFLAACNQGVSELPQRDAIPTDGTQLSRNAALETMAQVFAKAMADEKLRSSLHSLIAQKFDGDFNTLYREFVQANGHVQQSLAQAYLMHGLAPQSVTTLAAAESAVNNLAAAIPRFQISMPVQFHQWEVETYAPLVAFVPTGVEDTELAIIKAFDAEGNVTELDAQRPPEQPVIVLGISERTDDQGNLLAAFRPRSPQTTTELFPSVRSRKEVEVEGIDLYSDKEPWAKGDAEVKLIAKSWNGSDLFYHGSFLGANHDDGGYYDYNRVIGLTRNDVVFYWYEDDGGSLDITVSYRGVSLGVKIDDSDDPMGAYLVSYSYFGGTVNQFSTGDLRFDVR